MNIEVLQGQDVNVREVKNSRNSALIMIPLSILSCTVNSWHPVDRGSLINAASGYLERVTGEFFGTKVATCSPLSASVLQMILHQHAWNHRAALVAAGNRIVLAGIQVSLEQYTTLLLFKQLILRSNSIYRVN